MPSEAFSEEVIVDGVRFHAVKILHPQPGRLGTLYTADPVVDDVNTSLPLQLYVVSFVSQYYITSQGRKKLKQVEGEIRRLIAICHPNLLRIFAVKLTFPHASGTPRLVVLHEAHPGSTLRDVLDDCDSIKEERAFEYLVQILSALNTVHAADLVHRGIAADSIGITPRSSIAQKGKMLKLTKVAFYTRLLDLHRSNPFGPGISLDPDEPRTPDAWLSKDVKTESALLYTRHRDIHAVGLVLMQMLLGLDVTERYPDAYAAIRASSMSPNLQRHALGMLFPSKKNHLSCLSLLADLAEAPLSTAVAIKSPLVSSFDLKTPMPGHHGSPEIEFFRGPQRDRQASRWKEDWEELELLGKGAFGSVVKARNKIDSRIYAVKKIRLTTTQSDTKIFREVNALSRLSHRFIVRYFTTWVETTEAASAAVSDDSGAESEEDGMTSVPSERASRISSSDHITFDLGDLDDVGSASRSSFPSIHFSRSSSPRTDDGEEDDESDSDGVFGVIESSDEPPPTPPPILSRTLYIQMEFVERQTLKERIDEGLSEEEAWRLFQQILEALVYMSSLGIVYAKGDCKVGDFGLATSNLSAAEPSHQPHAMVVSDSEMTLEVGTRLYIAPEVRRGSAAPGTTPRRDMFSLGIVFFEMNYRFSTGAERIATPGIVRLTRQRQIITCLLDHDLDTRPTALELSQSPLLPARLEDEYFKGALGMMVKPDSPHFQAVLSSLFSQSQPPARRFLYDIEAELPEHAALNDIVQERLSYIFRLHGAVDMEPPMLMPIVVLPHNLLGNISRIKRYHIANVYRESFPNLNENYEIHISHSSIVRIILERIPSDLRPSILEIIRHSKSSPSQKRALLLKKGLLRSTADELEAMVDTEEDIDVFLTKLDKVSPSLTALLRPVAEEVKETIQYAVLTGVARPISIRPLMLGNHHAHFKDGVLVEVVRKNKRMDVLAAGGRYDALISDQATPGQKLEAICAMGLQIAVENITVSSVRALVKQELLAGGDVYVVSFHPGYLQDRLEVASFLWQHNISADLMYESSIPDAEHESYVDICIREGVLFSVYPRPRTGRRDQLAFKVKSILKGTEYELLLAPLRFSDIGVTHPVPPSKEIAAASAVQLLLPVDIKKQRKQVKQLFMDRAFETGLEIESGVQAGMPILAVDVLPYVFDAMIKSSTWLTDEEIWKALAATFPVQQWAYAQQIREAAVKRKAEGYPYILLLPSARSEYNF
ncbi:kinase-like domain-containing protein [Mycena vulgaris]|nr:kinase-like domain-containing protein [Mycena vulgaris]